jgi:hypothetical protein
MTSNERRAYSQQYIRQMNRLEKRYVPKIFKALYSQVQTFLDDMERNGLAIAQAHLFVSTGNDEIGPVLQNLHKEAGLYFGKKAYYEIRRSARKRIEKAGFGLSDEWLAAIIEFFKNEYFALVQRISETTRAQLFAVLTQAAEEGWSNDTIVKHMKNPELYVWRARLIARTELNKAAHAGRKLASDDSEWEIEKEWVAANDHRTRHSHRAADGDVIDFEKKFQVATPKGGVDLMDGPGDPTASAANLCNCRCSMSTRAKRDEQGRLIPKTKVIPIQPQPYTQTA